MERRVCFGTDQEELFYKARELLSGDPILLGMATSVGGFSISPLFNYLWTLFSFLFSGKPIAGNYLSVFLGIVTIITFYIAVREIFRSQLTALVIAVIYSFPFSIYVWDISPWPPSLFFFRKY